MVERVHCFPKRGVCEKGGRGRGVWFRRGDGEWCTAETTAKVIARKWSTVEWRGAGGNSRARCVVWILAGRNSSQSLEDGPERDGSVPCPK